MATDERKLGRGKGTFIPRVPASLYVLKDEQLPTLLKPKRAENMFSKGIKFQLLRATLYIPKDSSIQLSSIDRQI